MLGKPALALRIVRHGVREEVPEVGGWRSLAESAHQLPGVLAQLLGAGFVQIRYVKTAAGHQPASRGGAHRRDAQVEFERNHLVINQLAHLVADVAAERRGILLVVMGQRVDISRPLGIVDELEPSGRGCTSSRPRLCKGILECSCSTKGLSRIITCRRDASIFRRLVVSRGRLHR